MPIRFADKETPLTRERLMAALHYSPDTGIFTHLDRSANRKPAA